MTTPELKIVIDEILGNAIRRDLGEAIGGTIHDIGHLFAKYVLKGQPHEPRCVTDYAILKESLKELESQHPDLLTRLWLVDAGSLHRISDRPLTLQEGINLLRAALEAAPKE